MQRGTADAFDELLRALLAERARIDQLGGADAATQAAWRLLEVDAESADPEFAMRAIATPPR